MSGRKTRSAKKQDVAARINAAWDELEQKLSKSMRESLNDGATDEQLDALEKHVGFALGDGFRAFYKRHNGQDLEKLDEEDEPLFGEEGWLRSVEEIIDNAEWADFEFDDLRPTEEELAEQRAAKAKRAEEEAARAAAIASGQPVPPRGKGGKGLMARTFDDYESHGIAPHDIGHVLTFTILPRDEESRGLVLAQASGEKQTVLAAWVQCSTMFETLEQKQNKAAPSPHGFADWFERFVSKASNAAKKRKHKPAKGDDDDDDDDE